MFAKQLHGLPLCPDEVLVQALLPFDINSPVYA
jgi:hypothetical protein